MKTRIANKDCRRYVEARKQFTGSNLYAERYTASHGNSDLYVVYSYGEHWPLFVAEVTDDACGQIKWYEIADKFSPSTSRHQSQARPSYVHFTPMTAGAMRRLACDGIAGLAAMGEKS
jgi:hypothetical protein